MKSKLNWFFAAWMVSSFASFAAAGGVSSTTYAYSYVAGQSNYTVPAGTSFTVPLYLKELNSDGSTNSLINSQAGLFTAGTGVSFFSSSGGPPALILGIGGTSGTPPANFSTILPFYNTSATTILEQLPPGGSQGVTATPQGGGISLVKLATLTLVAPTTANTITTFTVGDYNPTVSTQAPPSGDTSTFISQYNLDVNANPTLYSPATPTTFTVTTEPVPEPVALSLMVFGGFALFQRKRV